VRIWRKIDKKDKTEVGLSEALLVSEDTFLKQYEEIDNLTKKIRFKANRLNEGKLQASNISRSSVLFEGALLGDV
jgi:hypothetical protein